MKERVPRLQAFLQQPPPTFSQPPIQKGEWYFYNAAYRTRGKLNSNQDGEIRPNLDNWRRSPAINAGTRNYITGVSPAEMENQQRILDQMSQRKSHSMRCMTNFRSPEE